MEPVLALRKVAFWSLERFPQVAERLRYYSFRESDCWWEIVRLVNHFGAPAASEKVMVLSCQCMFENRMFTSLSQDTPSTPRSDGLLRLEPSSSINLSRRDVTPGMKSLSSCNRNKSSSREGKWDLLWREDRRQRRSSSRECCWFSSASMRCFQSSTWGLALQVGWKGQRKIDAYDSEHEKKRGYL